MRAIFYLTWRKINFVLRSVGLFPNILALSVDKAGMVLYLELRLVFVVLDNYVELLRCLIN